MTKWRLMVLLIIVIALQIVSAIFVNYPVNQEQLLILNFFKLGGPVSLWAVRIVSLGLLCWSMWFWYFFLNRISDKNLAVWSTVLIVITPIFFVLWLSHPLVVIKVFLLMLVAALTIKLKRGLGIFLLLATLLLIALNIGLLENHPAILNKFSARDAQNEVTQRITREDTLLEKISLPLAWRRATYNKYFFVYKQVVSEVLPFFDFETIYFQEVHPMEQKSTVMFYWVEVYLLVLGIFFGKRIKKFSWLVSLVALAIVNYVFSEGEPTLRLLISLFPLSWIMALGATELLKGRWLAKGSLTFLTVMTMLGFVINLVDLVKRTDYWLDNRPLAYQFWFEGLKKSDLSNFEKIQVTSLIGNSKAYCYFYLGDVCDSEKITFSSFDLGKDSGVPKTIYAGFGGEFVGSDFKNNISNEWVKMANSKGLVLVGMKNLRDTIANKYGNDIGLMIKE